MYRLFTLIKTPLLFLLLMSCSGTLIDKESTSNQQGVTLTQLEGRNYYYFEDGTTCIMNAPQKPTVNTWVNKIEFTKTGVSKWGNLCNDAPTVIEYLANDFQFEKDLSSFIYQENKYKYYKEEPDM